MKKLVYIYRVVRAILGFKNSLDGFLATASTRKANISAVIIRANGTVEDRGVVAKEAKVFGF